MDMSTFMPMIKMSMEQEEEPDSQAAGDPEDTMEELFKRSELDTVISFADMMSDELNMGELSKEEILQRIEEEEDPDMSPEEKEKALEAMRALMDMEVRLRLSDSQNRYDMTFLQEFEDVNAMNEGANLFKSLSEFANESEEIPADEEAMSGLMGGNATYSLGKKTFGIRRPAPDLSELRQDEEMGMLMPMLENMGRGTLRIELPPDVPLDIALDVGHGAVTLNTGGLAVERLNLDLQQGDALVTLPAYQPVASEPGTMLGELAVQNGDITLVIDPDVAARLELNRSGSGIDPQYDPQFYNYLVGDVLEARDIEAAEIVVHYTVTAPHGQITVRQSGQDE